MGNDAAPHHVAAGAPTPAAVLEVTRQFLAELHPGAPRGRLVTLDTALERDLGLDSLSRGELAVHVERAFGGAIVDDALGNAVTVRDLLAAVREASGSAPPAAPGHAPAGWTEPAQAAPDDAETLIEVLDRHVREHPERVQIVHLGEAGETNIRYADLQRQADLVAAGLQRQGLEKGATVAIMLPTCPEYLHPYIGILRAGGIPVPIYPPEPWGEYRTGDQPPNASVPGDAQTDQMFRNGPTRVWIVEAHHDRGVADSYVNRLLVEYRVETHLWFAGHEVLRLLVRR